MTQSKTDQYEYEFERKESKKKRSLDEGTIDKSDPRWKLLGRLGMADEDISKLNDIKTLTDYTITFHENILWYTETRKEQMNKHRLFSIGTFLMLLLIPFIIFLVNYNLTQSHDYQLYSSETTIAMITGFLTFIFAFHNAYNAWLKNQQRVNAFWKASSELKTLLYSFESQWKNKNVIVNSTDQNNKEFNDEFLMAMKNEIIKGQAIEKAERDTFFENYTLPEFNLGNLISNAQTTAGNILTKAQTQQLKDKINFENEQFKKLFREPQLQEDIQRLAAEIALLKERIEELITETQQDPTTKSDNESEIKQIKTKLSTLQDQFISKQSELAALFGA